ncbi:hypothetical protein GQX73_g1455 [Xylaria multiplex]|uniref:Major facilitator superfamily (MFS) profile domain-containing protein n=1 Tax=Xylaria multiplex TaxID=323545 RepID=A0A7C8ITT3_9PEZI|nr:hypothetical protein GQX73_g1455 [Xylaria multiplex]
MESRTTHAGNGSLAEAAPLLGPRHHGTPGSSDKLVSHGAFSSRNVETSATDVENGSSRIEAGFNGGSGDLPKPRANMAALLPALAIGILLVALDQTLTIATYGKIGSELQALNNTSWIATSYFLTLTTFQPLYGKLSDIFGRKACLLFSYVVFGLGCLGCGLARDIVELCIARAISGIGGGGMNALVTILVTDLVSLRDRGVWQGYINMVFCIGMSAGAPVGGLFADNIGWRWAFIIQCPISLLAFISVHLVLHLPHTDHSHWSAKLLRIDFVGAFTLVSAVFLLLFGLDNGSNEGWTVYVTNFFGLAAQMGVVFFIALFFQAALGMSATWAGFVFMPSTVFSLSGSLGGGVVMKRTGRYYWLTTTGYCLLLLGCVPMVLGAGQQSTIITSVGLCILAFGASISITTTLIAIIANAMPGDAAVAIACSYLFRSLGTAIGIGISTATLQQMLRVNLAQELGGADRARVIEEQVRLSLDYIRRLDPDVAIIVRKCYAIATQWAFAPVATFTVLAITSSLFIREKKLDR